MNREVQAVKTIVKLYTRNGCHLCENGKAILLKLKQKWDFHYIEEDIEASDELTEQYGLMIPVIEVDGEEVQFGQIDEWTIEEALLQRAKLLS
ncbi:glutaredoxin family protein [Robertmurraya yapensis]|uniref:Glutaredoxin family protein n=1 Tax=Bacillus yapensis TaxID=2492960 RepID=A0A3S0KX06_9BACI|nr:glutaredoxin family protein [Bacillus yapensis]RTR36243.1 glutaredoxin family protein [Bacillus yapensis]TKT05746.1 glutaredoxin family protein [Bacillus yapensis]